MGHKRLPLLALVEQQASVKSFFEGPGLIRPKLPVIYRCSTDYS